MKTKLLVVVFVLTGSLFLGCGPTAQATLPPSTAEPIIPTLPDPTNTQIPSPTAIPEYYGSIGGDSANIRSGPGTNYDVITSFANGTELQVVGRNDDSSWLVINLPAGGTGWIRVDLILFTFPLDLLKIFAIPPTPTALPYVPPAATSCSGDTVSVTIINDTGGSVSLTLKGPCTYTFFIGTGSTSISIIPGSYSYTAYGCGGANLSGSKSLGSGDEWTWYCQ